MDRRTACIPKQQLGFYNFIARPMFEAMDSLISMEQPLSNLDIMCEHWSEQLPDDVCEPQAAPPTATKSQAELVKRNSVIGDIAGRVSRRASRRGSDATAVYVPGGTSPRRDSRLSATTAR